MSNCYKPLILNDEEISEFKEEILTLQHPLGAEMFEYYDDRYNPDLYHHLFNWHPDHFHEEIGIRPAIILGRRGSGKSSYLNNLAHKDGVISIPLKSWDAIDLVEKQVKLILENQDGVLSVVI